MFSHPRAGFGIRAEVQQLGKRRKSWPWRIWRVARRCASETRRIQSLDFETRVRSFGHSPPLRIAHPKSCWLAHADLYSTHYPTMWERTLQDLIRGLRANKKDESKFITQAVDEIRKEVRSKDMELKAAAILKLTYVSVIDRCLDYILLSMCVARHAGL
jgi:hypothetical protein